MRPYRTVPRDPSAHRGLVTAATYLDVVEAELARTRLTSEGIEAHVQDPTAFNPLLVSAAGGIRLQVDGGDLVRAQEILAEPLVHGPAVAADDEDDADDDAIRCPRCELTYCTYGRAHARTSSLAALLTIGIPLLLMGFFGSRKCWRCQRCEHEWDDPKEGPRALTRLEPGDPRPVFRLRRANAGVGLFAGMATGLPAALLIGSIPGALTSLGLVGLGCFIGSRIGSDLCSEPTCRAPLPAGAEECPRCKGSVAGAVSSASEHYAAAADFRRELAAIRAWDEKQRRKKPRRESADP